MPAFWWTFVPLNFMTGMWDMYSIDPHWAWCSLLPPEDFGFGDFSGLVDFADWDTDGYIDVLEARGHGMTLGPTWPQMGVSTEFPQSSSSIPQQPFSSLFFESIGFIVYRCVFSTAPPTFWRKASNVFARLRDSRLISYSMLFKPCRKDS